MCKVDQMRFCIRQPLTVLLSFLLKEIQSTGWSVDDYVLFQVKASQRGKHLRRKSRIRRFVFDADQVRFLYHLDFELFLEDTNCLFNCNDVLESLRSRV